MARYCQYCASKIAEGTRCTTCNFSQTYRAKPHHLQPGALLHGRYLIGVALGEGGFGITYLGRDLALDMKVAVKEYYPAGVAMRASATTSNVTIVSRTFMQDFYSGKMRVIEEAQALAKLDKEGAVVTVRDFFEENNSAYIVMEFVEGSDLRREIRRQQKPMEPQKLLTLLEPVFSALEELHHQGLVHRDISPDNIMLENDAARLIDFGCTVPTRHDGENINTVKHGFSPLEQYSNENVGPWSDVYAMAATIYYCITGKVPPKSIDRAVEDTLQPPSALGIKMKAKQEKALMRALSVNYQDRFQSMAEFGKSLFVHRNKYKLIAAAACLVAVLAVVVGMAIPRNEVVVSGGNKPKTVYHLTDEVPKEEEAKLKLLTKLLEKNTSIENEDYYYYIITKNTTGYDYKDVYISARFMDKDDTIIGSSYIYIEDWDKDASIREYVYCNETPAKVQLKMSYDVESSRFETEYVAASYEVKAKNEVVVANELPAKLTYTNYSDEKSVFKITAIDIEATYGGVRIYVDGEKISGDKDNYEYLDYRLISQTGAVVESGSLSIPRLSSGERFENANVYFYDLPAGSYQFELCDKDNS